MDLSSTAQRSLKLFSELDLQVRKDRASLPSLIRDSIRPGSLHIELSKDHNMLLACTDPAPQALFMLSLDGFGQHRLRGLNPWPLGSLFAAVCLELLQVASEDPGRKLGLLFELGHGDRQGSPAVAFPRLRERLSSVICPFHGGGVSISGRRVYPIACGQKGAMLFSVPVAAEKTFLACADKLRRLGLAERHAGGKPPGLSQVLGRGTAMKEELLLRLGLGSSLAEGRSVAGLWAQEYTNSIHPAGVNPDSEKERLWLVSLLPNLQPLRYLKALRHGCKAADPLYQEPGVEADPGNPLYVKLANLLELEDPGCTVIPYAQPLPGGFRLFSKPVACCGFFPFPASATHNLDMVLPHPEDRGRHPQGLDWTCRVMARVMSELSKG